MAQGSVATEVKDSRCDSAGVYFATAERRTHDQAQTGNPRHVNERLATGGEIIEFRLHVQTHEGTIGIGG